MRRERKVSLAMIGAVLSSLFSWGSVFFVIIGFGNLSWNLVLLLSVVFLLGIIGIILTFPILVKEDRRLAEEQETKYNEEIFRLDKAMWAAREKSAAPALEILAEAGIKVDPIGKKIEFPDLAWKAVPDNIIARTLVTLVRGNKFPETREWVAELITQWGKKNKSCVRQAISVATLVQFGGVLLTETKYLSNVNG